MGKVGLGDLGGDAVKLIASGEVQMVVNTPSGSSARSDGARDPPRLRGHGVACVTTLSAGFAAAKGIADTREHGWRVRSLQELHSVSDLCDTRRRRRACARPS